MKIRNRMIATHMVIGIIPILLSLLIINLVLLNREEDGVRQKLFTTANDIKTNLLQDMGRFQDYAYFFANSVLRTDQESMKSLTGYSIKLWVNDYQGVNTIEATWRDQLARREAGADGNTNVWNYGSSSNMLSVLWKQANRLWMGDPRFRMYYPDFLSNLLIIRNTAVIPQRGKYGIAGVMVVSVALDTNYLQQLGSRFPDLIVFTDSEKGLLLSRELNPDKKAVNTLRNTLLSEYGYSTVSIGGRKYYFTKIPLFNLDRKIVASLGILYGYQSVNTFLILFRQISLAVLLAAAIVALLIAVVIANRLTQPVIRLNEGARQIAEGNLDLTVPSDSNDEIGELAVNFNRMSQNLRESFQLIRENNELLEKRVAERTEELLVANKKLQTLDQLKSDFLTMVSHEVKTPLTSILGFSKIILKDQASFYEILDSHSDPQKARQGKNVVQALEVILKESAKLNEMLSNVIDVTTMQAGRVNWEDREVRLENVLAEAEAHFRPEFEKKGIRFDTESGADIPAIRADPKRIRQLFNQLLSNALQFTDSGTVSCTLRSEEGHAVISIRDTGCGIPATEHEKVFDQFRQVGDITVNKPKGIGLGLAICKHIVIHYGGEIRLTSAPGEGSEFTVLFPHPPREGAL